MSTEHKNELDALIKRLHITRVGSGFQELICPKCSIAAFIDAMDQMNIRIKGFTWWCHVTDGHEPCGMGGPRDVCGEGWYSEIHLFDFTVLGCNDAYRRFFLSVYPHSTSYKPCRVPAFSLEEL